MYDILIEAQVIAKASDTMIAIAMINSSIEVIHPGNTTQFYKQPVEFSVIFP